MIFIDRLGLGAVTLGERSSRGGAHTHTHRKTWPSPSPPLSAAARTSLRWDGCASTWTHRTRTSWRALSSTAARALTSIAQTTSTALCAFARWLRMELAGSGRRSTSSCRQHRQRCPPLQGCRLCRLLHRLGPRHQGCRLYHRCRLLHRSGPRHQGCRLYHLHNLLHLRNLLHLSVLRPCHPLFRPCHPLSAHRRPHPRASTTIHSIHARSSGDLTHSAPIQCVRQFAAPLADAAP